MKNESKKKHVSIFMATDDRYLPYLIVAVKSISLHSSDEYIYDVRILNKGLSRSNVRKLRHMSFDNVVISLVDVGRVASSIRPDMSDRLRDYHSEEIYYSMFIADMYPRLTRAVYIDCDVVLVDDIAKLYFTDIGDNILGAVADESVAKTPELVGYVERWVGIPKEQYFNSGVLLMNLSAFRKHSIAEKFKRLLLGYNFDTVLPGRDYLNFLCKGMVAYLDGGWNKQPFGENASEISEQHLIHYSSYGKPWHYREIPDEDAFWDVARRTPYYTDILGELVEYTDRERERDKASETELKALAEHLSVSRGGFAETLGDNYSCS